MDFVRGTPREQIALFPEVMEDYIPEDNPVRFIDAFVEEMDLMKLGFEGTQHASTGRPPYHPRDLLKLQIYGSLNKVRSSSESRVQSPEPRAEKRSRVQRPEPRSSPESRV